MTEAKRAIRFRYVNHTGRESVRTVRPLRFIFGEVEWYEGDHIFMLAYDMDKRTERLFMMSRMKDIEEVEFGMTYTVTIPDWHPTRLNVLLESHWAVANAKKKADAQMLAAYAKMAGVTRAEGKRRVSLEIHGWARGRMCDPDAFWKALLDACVRIELLVDDSQAWCECGPVTLARSREKKTIITLEDV